MTSTTAGAARAWIIFAGAGAADVRARMDAKTAMMLEVYILIGGVGFRLRRKK